MPKTRRNRKKTPSKSRPHSRTRSKPRKYYGVTGGDVRSKGEPRFNYSGITGGDVRSKGDVRFNYSGITGGDVRSKGDVRFNYSGVTGGDIRSQIPPYLSYRGTKASQEREKRLKELKKKGAYFENGLLYNKYGKRIDTLGRLITETEG